MNTSSGHFLPRYRGIFACPRCHGLLSEPSSPSELGACPQQDSQAPQGWCPRCDSCGQTFAGSDGEIDFTASISDESRLGVRKIDIGRSALRLQDPLFATRYEKVSRPNFLKIMGSNWASAMTPADEIGHLIRFIRSAPLPVVDLACGAGHWTRTVIDTVGVDHVVGVDLSPSLLRMCRIANPGLLALRANAAALPFRSGSVGTIICWNAMQQMPDPVRVIGEIARCLCHGGVAAIFTYRKADTPAARYFQARFESVWGSKSYTISEFTKWLEQAGFEVLEIGGPGSFLLAHARRREVNISSPKSVSSQQRTAMGATAGSTESKSRSDIGDKDLRI